MVFVRAWVMLVSAPPVRFWTMCSALLLWMGCKIGKPGERCFGRPLAVLLLPWVLPIGTALYLRENWRVVLIDMLVMWDRVKSQSPTPTLAVADGAAVPFAHSFAGSAYQLGWSPDLQHLAVTSGDRQLWRSRAGQPFVAAAGASVVVAETCGNFNFKDRIEWQCVAQRIERVEAAAGGAVIHGRFDDGGAMCSGLTWSLSFGVAGSHLHFDLQLGGAT